MSKVFDEKNFDEDDWAKFCLINWLQKNGYEASVNPDQYGIDVLASRDLKHYAFEVEVKHNWTEYRFPFKAVHFSARKLKFVSFERETWFVMLNHHHTNSLFVSAEDFANAPLVTKSTIYSENEQFVEIPVEMVRFIDFSETA